MRAEPAACVTTLDEVETHLMSSKHGALLVQLGSEFCARCPGFTEAVKEIAPHFHFDWVYADAAVAELREAYGITRLPAFLLCTKGVDMPFVAQNATPADLSQAIQAHCRPMLALDDDF